jgi:imidazole glycerol-phosphate synthase subunit HisH
MSESKSVAIIDYGMGNLFSVERACSRAGLNSRITGDPGVVRAAAALILPGVGAFGDAMDNLKRMGLVEAIKDVIAAGKPLLGICLGMQLLMDESEEFGNHRGLGVFKGRVLKFPLSGPAGKIKVPQVGWNKISVPVNEPLSWQGTCLDGIADNEYMYFVHSFYVEPADDTIVLSRTRYEEIDYCSAIKLGSVFACQFHPERSADVGIRLYRNFAGFIEKSA